MSGAVVPLAPSPVTLPLDALGKTIKAHVTSAAKAEEKAEQHYKSAGLHLLEAKQRIDAGSETITWTAFFRDHCELGRSRAYELIALAEGRTSLAKLRDNAADRQRKARAPTEPVRDVTDAKPVSGAVAIGKATLYNGDCRVILPSLGSVSHILTDPPYEVQAHKRQIRTHKDIKSGKSSGLGFDAITEDLRSFVAAEAARLASGWALFFCQHEAVGRWQDAVVAGGAKWRSVGIWVKPDSSPQFTGNKPAVNHEPFVLAWCGKGDSKWNAGGKRGTYTHNVNGRQRDGRHPTEKPISLAMELVKDFTNPGDIILDPFMGSGSFGVAALALDRQYIGIESDPAFFAIARERIEAANGVGTLFADNDNQQLPLVAPEPAVPAADDDFEPAAFLTRAA